MNKPAHSKILVVEDNPQDREILLHMIRGFGYPVVFAANLHDARVRLETDPSIAAIVADENLPDGMGSVLLDWVQLPVLLVTAFGDIQQAVEAMRRGARHYLIKPIQVDEFQILLERCVAAEELSREVKYLREIHAAEACGAEFVIRSSSMKDLFERIRAASQSDATVLILGESGTGKELVARALHRLSGRAAGPMVGVNCGAIPATLLEAELFGHEKGAFTGALARRIGKFERAHRGTLFLDEIGTLPLELQSRLLRSIQEREIERIGGSEPIRVDFRLIAATNADLEKAMGAGTFREDLYYRLNVLSLRIPPLRERKDEIPALIAHFLAKRNAESAVVEPGALERMMAYEWPGNIRELENAIEHALVVSQKEPISTRHLPEQIRGEGTVAESGTTPIPADGEFPTLDFLKRRHIMMALRRSGGKRDDAAHLLGIHRNTLRGLIRRYEIDAEDG